MDIKKPRLTQDQIKEAMKDIPETMEVLKSIIDKNDKRKIIKYKE